jgi:peptidoglycan/LPS O-acetylase OafA/YrhL
MRKTELKALTGIRFYAALFVFLSHVTVIPGMERLGGGRLIFNVGVVGVSLFFVLSGFILTYNYADVFRSTVSLATYTRFVWDRWTKIYPVHLATFLIILPIQMFSPNLPLDWRAVPIHLLLLQCWWPLTQPKFLHYLNVPSWSISCEWFFYLMAPMAIFCVLQRKWRWIPVLLTAGAAGGTGLLLWHNHSDASRLYFVSWFAPFRFIEFLTGVFIAHAFMANRKTRSTTYAVAAQILGLGLIVAGAMYRAHAPWPLWGGLLYLPGSALLVFGLAQNRGLFAAHLSHPWLERLGMASFCLYMLQAPLLRAIRAVWLHFDWEVRSWAAFSAVVVVMLLFVQTSAFLLHHFYEMPMQRCLRTLLPTQRLTTSHAIMPPRVAA